MVHPSLHRFQDTAYYWANFHCREGGERGGVCVSLTHSFGVNPKFRIGIFDIKKPQMSFCRTVQNTFWYLKLFS